MIRSAKQNRVAPWMAILMVLMCAVLASAEQVTVEYTFTRPDIQQIMFGSDSYDRVVMEDAPNCANPGQPLLPATGAWILLPMGAEVQDVQVIPGKRVLVGSGYRIEPAGRTIKLSADPGTAQIPVPDVAIYSSSNPYPSTRFENVGVQNLRGYRILILKLNPAEYIPVTGELYYYPHLRVGVTLADARSESPFYRGFETDHDLVLSKVDNPDMVDTYAPVQSRAGRGYDLLILTTTALDDNFLPLKNYHDATGMLTEIHTTTEIGSTDPTDVRDYIRDRYLYDGIQYVLIGGDDNIIPALDVYAEGNGGSDVEYNMPADIYFSCLNGTWNYDGDTRWGEPYDGDGGGAIDLTAEVYVGRASVGSTTETNNFVNKTIAYLSSSGSYLQDVLMCGEYLGFGGVSDWGGNMMDEMVDGSSASGYTTVGISSTDFNIDYLYDRDWSGNDWPSSQVVSRINSGRHIINHLGHGFNNWALKLYSSSATSSLYNNEFCFLYSQACLAGHFDGTDCWAEYMTVKDNDEAFAVIMNVRSGWGTENTTDGPSQRFNREFWDAVFGEGKLELGLANQDSKEDNLYRINQNFMRWCYYEITLFGDPTVVFRSQGGLAFDYPNGTPSTTLPDQATSFEVVVSGASGGIPQSNSGQIHYSVNGGATQTDAMTQISANHYEATLPVLTCDDELSYYVSAEETANGRMYDPDPGSPRVLIPVNDSVVIFEDDFETNKGWTVSGDASDGHWERGVPADGARCDPPTDYDGSGQCYLTKNIAGNSDVDNGTTWLDSPTFDLSGVDGVVSYARWYCNDYGANPYVDVFVVYVSNDNGAEWTTVEVVGPEEQASGGWYEHSFQVGLFVTPTDQMKVRFEASDLGESAVVEAAVDQFEVLAYDCFVDGDDDLDGILNSVDNCPQDYNPLQENADNDAYGNICDECPLDSLNDIDNDNYCADVDNCPSEYNPDQIDADGDDFGAACDCDDLDENLNPNTVWYQDSDGDTYGRDDVTLTQCEQPVGYVLITGDCDDTNEDINPETIWYEDSDGDEFGNPAVILTQCEQPIGYILVSGDCDDTDGNINPNTIWYEDPDADGYGNPDVSLTQCEQPDNYVLDNTDNCPYDYNPGQEDEDLDGIGDACETCCISPSVGDLDQGGGALGFNYDGADLSLMINGLFIDPANGWDGICLDEADVDFSSPVRPVEDPMTIDGADLSLLIDALFIAPTHFLKNCDGTDNY